MAYISLYRKYRPQRFEDVVGQEHVTRTLQNAIKEGRIASGYLFTGTRGTAKTTCARILAKALNCIGPDGRQSNPTPEPCGVCGPCQSIAASSFVDVLEMDAASHGKVDDVRDLVASIKFPPMEGRTKVYIIDEAHQLSRDAMDAFLKTLEEPPPQVVFVLATTELEKLPITIASRCQVFEFKRGSIAQIAARLTEVLGAEGVAADPSAITLIARAAEGSYRDALSLLEQVLAYKRDQFTARDVTVVLGTVDEDMLNKTVSVIADSDAAAAFTLAGDVVSSGKDIRQFLKSLSARFRDMLFVAVGAQPAESGDLDDSPTLRAHASRFSPAALLQALEALSEAERETKGSNQHRLLLELTLLRLMELPSIAPPAPNNGGAGEESPNPPITGGHDKTLTPPLLGAGGLPSSKGSKEVGSEGEAHSNGLFPAPAAVDDVPLPIQDGENFSDALDDIDIPVPGDEDLDSLPLDDDEELAPSLLVTSPEERENADDLLHVQQVAAAPLSSPTPPMSAGAGADAPPDLTRLQKSWQTVINRMESRSEGGARVLRAGTPVAMTGHTFTLEFANPLYVDLLNGDEKRRRVIEDVINKTLDEDAGLFKIKCARQGEATIKAAVKTGANTPQSPDTHSPWVDEVLSVFGGRLLDDNDVKG